MGQTISSFSQKLFPVKTTKILLLGLSGAGKRTMMFKFRRGEVYAVDNHVQTLEYKNLRFFLWDLIEEPSQEQIWETHLPNTSGLIFLVDSANQDNINLARDQLHKLLAEKNLAGVPLLIIANKQDLNGLNSKEVNEKLGLTSIKDRQWHIEEGVTATGKGIYEGLDWLQKVIA